MLHPTTEEVADAIAFVWRLVEQHPKGHEKHMRTLAHLELSHHWLMGFKEGVETVEREESLYASSD